MPSCASLAGSQKSLRTEKRPLQLRIDGLSQRPAYNYGSTARKLDHTLEAPRHGIEVMPGGAHQERAASSGAILFAKLLIAFVVAFAAIGCVRITLSSATVATAMEARQIDSQISDAREVGNELEVAQASLANPTRVKRDAIAQGMRSPAKASFIDISGDVVVRDDDGRLSLSGTIEAVAEQATASSDGGARVADAAQSPVTDKAAE